MLISCGAALLSLVVATNVMDVPDPRPERHVVDLTGTLTQDDIGAIDASAKKAAEKGELFVVVVQSTDGANPREWTTALFNRLRLDTKERNRGVVFMAALKDRKAEIVIGDGFPSTTTNDTDTIMAGVVVANFKRGDPRAALVQGAQQIAERVILAGDVAGAGGAEALLAYDAPVVPPEVVQASGHELVTSVADTRGASLLVDKAALFDDAEKQRLADMQDMMHTNMNVIVVTLPSTEPLARSTYAQALAHRMGLNDTKVRTSRDLLIVVVTGTPNAVKPVKGAKGVKTAKAEPSIDVIAGAGLPGHLRDLSRVADAWRARIASGTALDAATVAAVDDLKLVPMDVNMFESVRRAEERNAKEQRDAAWRAQMAAQQAEAEQSGGGGGDGAFFDDDNPLAWGVGGAGLFGVFLAGREVLRRRPRSCKKCNLRMHRLAEELDDKHLKEGERAEERLGSVDYDIWACGQCGDVLKTRWGAIFTSYSKCNSCSWKTMTSTSRTITAATTSSTGLAEVTDDCKHCSYHRTYTRVIPRVTKSSSSGSSSGGGGGFSSGRGSSGSW